MEEVVEAVTTDGPPKWDGRPLRFRWKHGDGASDAAQEK